ncbi:hypothetical protein [Alcaligenes sp.]|uniref:hypothetical protein n=1 Tax=Alcaligenes sp. TaxID=512 RepID=UPI003CFBD367
MNHLFLLLLVLLSGCALQTAGHHLDPPWLDDAVFLGTLDLPTDAPAQSVDRPWLLGAAVPIQQAADSPDLMSSRQTFSFSLETPLPGLDELARRLSFLSDLTVSISPEARLPLALFLPRLSVGDQLDVPPQYGSLVFEQLRLPELLNQVSAVYSIRWRYRAGRIELYRTETRHFALPPIKAVNAAYLDKPAANAFESAVTSVQTETPSLENAAHVYLQDTAQAFLSRAGRVQVLGVPPHALLVTDTPERLEALGSALKHQPELWYFDSARASRSVGSGGREK